ncbi:hypothetical protein [Rickettsiella endosymbiont of Dermanyssus gallinae]|uniref:hypothetical protein n=1 Tax=Rickettsiella endosymbiont of Dermanyssus gallinae TaxID=2856608 RepID=UPI001C52938D|nr:hypothetical protein [Rickettsiella endosymbiont of Dermanyssus gallinae]
MASFSINYKNNMPIKANFKSSFNHPSKNSVCVLTVISMNSEKQSEDNFKAFLLALNEQYEFGRVHKLIIVVSGGLHRHYIGLDKKLAGEQVVKLANDMDEAWIASNQEILNCLKFDYQIITWDKLLEDKEEFQVFFVQVKNDYLSKDKAFRSKVLQHSGGYYAEKLYAKLRQKMPDITLDACREAAINYVLDECAVLVSLNRLADYLVYPGKMNPCASHIYKNYFSDREEFLRYIEYSLTMPKQVKKETASNDSAVDVYGPRFFCNSKQLDKKILCSTKTLLKELNNYDKVMFSIIQI